MCTGDLYVTNNSRRFIPNFHKVNRRVPCGQCDSCRENDNQGWLVRLFTELKYFESIGGRNIFVTLTYNDKCRPWRTYDDHITNESFHIPVFLKDDMDRFMNSFKQWFLRRGVDGVRYFWASEYGKDPKGSHRQHFHPIFHIPPCDISTKDICDEIESLWTYEDKYGNRKSLGWVLWSDAGPLVKSKYAASYVSKYVSKDVSYYQQPDVEKFLDKSCISYEDRKYWFRHYKPRHWQSKGYGSALFSVLNLDPFDSLENGFRLADDTFKVFSVPRYNASKFLYMSKQEKIDKFGFNDPRLWLSDNGIKFYEQSFEKDIHRKALLFQKVTSHLYINQYFTTSDYSKMPRRFLSPGLSEKDSLYNYLENLFGSSDSYKLFRSLALYEKVWQNRTFCTDDEFIELSQMNPLSDAFYNFTYSIYQNGLYISPTDYPLVEPLPDGGQYEYISISKDRDSYNHVLRNLYNNCLIFDKYDEMIKVLLYLTSLSVNKKLSALLIGREERSKYKRSRLNREHNYLKT